MRAFLAIDLPEDLRAQVAALQAGLRAGRPVPEENLHLTLAFLDDQPQAMLVALHEALNALDCPGFDLELAGLDLFGGKRPRLLYLRVKPAPALLALHRSLKEAARRVGMDLPRTRFRPHVTLARFRHDMTEP
ncbi:RNA 2',3'-cyclic phosphodiesterase, partial [Shimia sp.]|uniref:RNA 2',3'-cyclic phosphodiesterase n=1 Tax=Shimia sp. TaxID=1954381 RepID=UPI00356B0B7D